jgi:hypothetical protein
MSFLGLATLIMTAWATAAELPGQVKKPNPEAVKKCNIGGVSGVVAADGLCVKIGGYISTQVEGGQLKPQYNWGSLR